MSGVNNGNDVFGYSPDELRRLIQEGIDSGRGRFGSIDEIIAEAHHRWIKAHPHTGMSREL